MVVSGEKRDVSPLSIHYTLRMENMQPILY